MSIKELEKNAGMTDREAFWMPFAKIKGTVKINGKECCAGLQAGVEQLRHIAATQEHCYD